MTDSPPEPKRCVDCKWSEWVHPVLWCKHPLVKGPAESPCESWERYAGAGE